MVHIVQHIGFKALSTELVEFLQCTTKTMTDTSHSGIGLIPIIKRRGRCNLTCPLINYLNVSTFYWVPSGDRSTSLNVNLDDQISFVSMAIVRSLQFQFGTLMCIVQNELIIDLLTKALNAFVIFFLTLLTRVRLIMK